MVVALAAAAVTLALGAAALGADDAAFSIGDDAATPLEERQLVQAMLEVRNGHLEHALGRVQGVVERRPDFELAQLVYGDVLRSFINPLASFGPTGKDVASLRHEAVARLGRYTETPPPGSVPRYLLKLPESIGSTLLVDVKGYRLYLFEQDGDQLKSTRDYYVSIGKSGGYKQREGDERTPLGVYRVDSYLPGNSLPDLYGDGAFPIDYPNGWDVRRGRTGSGIWIHGTESERYSRPPLSSRGCVTLSNLDFSALRERVVVGETPVILVDGIEWTSPEDLRRTRDGLLATLESWRRDWESRDTDSYLSHYDRDFQTEEMNRASFAAYKRRVNAGKRYIDVRLSDVGAFLYPGEDDLAVVDFVQDYASDNFRSQRRKRQYWHQDTTGRWRILYETSADRSGRRGV